jgi:AcrR family transcriptional regulator
MDEKKHHIVMAAGETFTRYGFKKASMQDIADTAKMSRAALYLHFRNKDDLFRTLMDWHHGEALKAAEAAFTADRPFLARMEAALLDFTLVLFGPVKESAHGQELFDANMALAGDTTAATSLRLRALMQSAVTQAVSNGEISLSATGLSAETLTDLLYVCLDGIKKAAGGLDRLEERLKALMRVIDVATRTP